MKSPILLHDRYQLQRSHLWLSRLVLLLGLFGWGRSVIAAGGVLGAPGQAIASAAGVLLVYYVVLRLLADDQERE